ncbi:MAG: Si-specific NAD(P)(+) transhydrogenase [Elusimicrobiota bacterium]
MKKGHLRYDLVVIGSGPAGQKGAVQAAKLGKKVAVVERRSSVGGASAHTGTIPSKTLREAALYLTGWDQRGLYGAGYRLKSKVTMPDLIRRLRITLKHETAVTVDQLRRNGVEVLHGTAAFAGPHSVDVRRAGATPMTLRAGRILVATGTRPLRPGGLSFDGRVVVDSDGILGLGRVPRSLVVVGGGVIGLEYASIFSLLDVKVTLVDRRTRLLDFLDREMLEELLCSLRSRGVRLLLGTDLRRIRLTTQGRAAIRLEGGRSIEADAVLVAAGRIGNTGRLGLEKAGLRADEKGRIRVSRGFRTDVLHIFAAGDVIGFPSLASTSMEQGRLAVRRAFGLRTPAPVSDFPFGVYSVPEISMAGRTESELSRAGRPFLVGRAPLRETARGQILGLREGLLKMVFSRGGRRLLGVHIIGEGATELVHIGQAVMALGGGLDYFMESVFNYPTLAEAYKVAALDASNRLGARRRDASKA